VTTVRLSEIAVIKAMLESLIKTEETSLAEIIRNHQFHTMEAKRYELRMLEVESARNQWKNLLNGIK
jgi:hypothetical protein